MDLPSPTLKNLELFKSSLGDERHSLFHHINCTKTRFGARLLKRWLLGPLLDVTAICERQNMIEEVLKCDKTDLLSNVIDKLSSLPDVEKGLLNILHKKCSLWEFYSVVDSLHTVWNTVNGLLPHIDQHVKNKEIKAILINIVDYLAGSAAYIKNIQETSAR